MLKMQFFLTFILQVSNSSSPVGRAILPVINYICHYAFMNYICNYAFKKEISGCIIYVISLFIIEIEMWWMHHAC
jgi:hypothetical protein